jgi:hypothetical protein
LLNINIDKWYIYKFLSKKLFFDIFYNKISIILLINNYKVFFNYFERGILEFLGPLGIIYVNNNIFNLYIYKLNTGLIYHYSYLFLIFSVFIIINNLLF